MSGKHKKSKNADGTQVLPSKEGTLYKTVLRHYEQKQYKKGVKVADQILKTFPNHGETTCLKGLIMQNMGRKEEAYALVKKGVSHHMGSHAIKCYRQALKIDKENAQILTDLSWLLMQTRDVKGFCDTRKQLLIKQNHLAISWMSLSVGHYLCKNYSLAISVLDSFMKKQEGRVIRPSVEESEMLMFKVRMLEESNEVEAALALLDEREKDIVDVVEWRSRKGRYLLSLGRFTEARQVYRLMMKTNTDSYEAHRGFQCSILEDASGLALTGCDHPLGVQDSQLPKDKVDILVNMYKDFVITQPKVWAHRRIQLDFIHGDDFRVALNSYLKIGLRKGVPSLFSSLKTMYTTARSAPGGVVAAKVAIIGEVVQGYVDSMGTDGCLPGEPKKDGPTVMLWSLFFLARHYDKLANYPKALELINNAIEHTPTLVDVYQAKARILKHMGSLSLAAETFNEGRKLDEADRYMNSKCGKYQLRANDINSAATTIAMFTRHEGSPEWHLHEMQCMWYAIEAGHVHLRTSSLPRALKYFSAVEGYFQDFMEDQHDFHRYCLKKGTLRAYLDFVTYLDTARGDHFFVDAMEGAMKCLLTMHDYPSRFVEKSEDGEDLASMSSADRKRAKQKAEKAKKKEAKAAAEAEEKAKVEAALEKAEAEKKKEDGVTADDAVDVHKEKEPVKEVVDEDKDPLGTVAFKTKLEAKPIEEAARICGLLMEVYTNSPSELSLSAALIMFDVQVRRGMWLLAMNALTLAETIVGSAQHPDILRRRLPFAAYIATNKVLCGAWTKNPETFEGSVDIEVDSVVKELVLSRCGGGATASVYVDEAKKVVAAAGDNYALVCAATEAITLIDPSDVTRAGAVEAILAVGVNVSVACVVDGGLALKRLGGSVDVLAKLKKRAVELFPEAESTFTLRWM